MSLVEKDPRDIGYLALYCAIKWYKYIDPEAALRIAKGRSAAKPGRKLTPELRELILKTLENPNFKSFDAIEKKYKINRYSIIASEEDFVVGQIENHLKQLKNISITCNGLCEKCLLNININEDGKTMCEFLQEIDFENPQSYKNKAVNQSKLRYTDLLQGEKVIKSFKLYKPTSQEFEGYIRKKTGIQIGDIVSKALLEYMERHR
jgi:hypothetical protein